MGKRRLFVRNVTTGKCRKQGPKPAPEQHGQRHGKQGSTIAKHTMSPLGFPEGLKIFMGLWENYILMQTSQARQMTVRRLPMATQSPTLWTCGAFGPTGAGTKPMPLMTASHSQRKVSFGVLMVQ